MSSWQTKCMEHLRSLIANGNCLHQFDDLELAQFHVAVFAEPYLSFILAGKKTVESRFSRVRCSPYQSVRRKDIVLLKRSGGPVTAVCRVEAVWFYEVSGETLRDMRKIFSDRICPANTHFWAERSKTSFATLMSIGEVTPIPSFRIEKKDRRGWVTLKERATAT